MDEIFPLIVDGHAAQDGFNEQAEDPDLMRRRGLRPGEPLPRELGLFDADGRPLTEQHRANWLRLLDWLRDDEAILSFAFPDGLDDKWREILQADLTVLHRQPWSPEAFVEAVLADWPEDQPVKTVTLEDAERRLLAACEQFLAENPPPE